MKPFKTRPKYGATRTGGYASKREAEYAQLLQLRKNAGDILDWLEQVPIKMPGCKYVVDFMIVNRDGTVQFVEVKGVETQQWKLKMRLLAELRPEIFARLEVVK